MPQSLSPETEYELIRSVFAGMAAGPKGLEKHLNFFAENWDPPLNYGERNLCELLGKIDDIHPIGKEIQRRLQEWDFAENIGWVKNTRKNTDERRNLIYDLLKASKVFRKLSDGKFPAYTSYIPPIIIAEKHKPWYQGPRRFQRTFYWDAYSSYLRKENRWSEESIQILNEGANKIVERISDPEQEEQYQSKGLVVGHVQSGKTANFTGVIAKAADAGYRLFIILAGTMNILRNQTQRRIDKELIGKEMLEKDYINDIDWNNFLSHGYRPSERNYFDWHRLTGPEEDYQSLRRGIESLEFNKHDPGKPFFDPSNLHRAGARIMVIKKTPTILKKVARDLSRIQARLEEIPCLVIDDESDQASINTLKQKPSEAKRRTATNHAITKFLQQLPRAQYVGYTATPFANVFIDPADAEDLFPKDFMVSLQKPVGYMGITDFYDLEGEKPKGLASNEGSYVRPVKGNDDDPLNLRQALDSYVLSGAIKLFRQHRSGKWPLRHHTMLIHVSHRVRDHDEIADQVERLFSGGGYDAGDGTERLKKIWDNDYLPVILIRNKQKYPVPESFRELRNFIGQCLQKIQDGPKPVLVVNGEHEEDSPDFDKESVWKIIVGGAKLSRGYTIEGLTISYYRRKTMAADTLMQMGRWFGFRNGYQDLVRLYIGREEPGPNGKTTDLYLDFEGVCRDEMEFRRELERYAMPDNGDPITPKQIPPLVPSHRLAPTSKAKMFNATIQFENFGGKQIQSTRAANRSSDALHNYQLMYKLLSNNNLSDVTLGVDSGGEIEKFDARTCIISGKEVVEFLAGYRWTNKEPVLQRQIEFFRGTGEKNPEIERWVFIAPEGPKKGPVFELGKNRFRIFHRSRSNNNERYGVYSEPFHINAAKYISMIGNNSIATGTTKKLQRSRQGVFLFYPVNDKGKDPAVMKETPKIQFVTMGFVLITPRNSIRTQIKYTVIDSSKKDAVVVDAND